MNFRRPFAFALLSAVVAAQAPYTMHFEFDQPGVLPSATPGVGVFNATFTPTTTFFQTQCGVLQQRTIYDPSLGAGFFGGTYGFYGTAGPGLTPSVATFVEARFTLLGGTGGPGTVPNSTGVLGCYPGANCVLIVNVITGDVALNGASGAVWTTPPGTAFTSHTYRLETFPIGASTYMQLLIDGFVYIAPILATNYTGADGWFMGDSAGSNSISTSIDWQYLTVSQAVPYIGQANSGDAALFVNRSNTTASGAIGLRGPFVDVVPGGTTMTIEWNGPAGAPYAMFVGPQWPAAAYFGCVGSLDIGTPPSFADLVTMFDPFSPWTGFMFYLDGCGYAKQTFTIPPLPAGYPLINMQGLIFQPFTSSCPFVLTAAHYVYS